MIEPDTGNIAAALRRHAQENDAAHQIAPLGPEGAQGPDPNLVKRLHQWAAATPTLPAGAMLSVAQADIDPASPAGQYLITNAVPQFLFKPINPAQAAQSDMPGSSGYAMKQLVNDPQKLELLKTLPLDQLSNLSDISARSSEASLGDLSPQEFGQVAQSGVLPDPGALVDATMGAARELGAVAQSGLETIGMGVRQQGAGLAHGVSNLAHGELPSQGANAYGAPAGPQDYTTPKFSVPGVQDIPGVNQLPGIKDNPLLKDYQGGGTDIHFGSAQELADPGQITLVQQARGESLGQGLLPGGPAVEKADAAKRAAATVAGHALTPGRALASFVSTPDSLAYTALSGTVDAYVALHADPALLIAGELTKAVKAGKTIGTVTDDAIGATADHLIDALGPHNAKGLRAWAGDAPDLREAIINKITENPASIRALVDSGVVSDKQLASAIVGRKAGLMSGLYNSVHPDNFQQFLVGPEGDQFFNRMGEMGFTDIGHKTNWSLSAKLQLALADSTTADEARAALQDHVSTLRSLPTLGRHPVSDMRWASILPTEVADVSDADHMLVRARQDLQLLKVPRAEWDNFLPAVVKSEGNYDAAFSAFTKIGDRGADNILAKIPGYADAVTERTTLRAQIAELGDHVVPTKENQALFDRLDQLNAKITAHDTLARKLTNYFYEKGNQSRIWHNAELGGSELAAGLAPTRDGMVAIEGPFGASELLNRGIPTLGGNQANQREIMRAVGTWAPLFNSPVIGKLPRATRSLLIDSIADNLTNLMKSFAMARVGTGVRILGTQGARMAAAGVGDLSQNPMGLLGLIAGAGDVDMTGEKLIGQLGQYQNRLAAAVGRATDWRAELAGANKATYKGWANFDTATREGVDAWANRLSHTANEPVASSVAKALVNGESLDAVKQSVWDGALSDTRRQMIDANVTWGHGDYVGYSRDLVDRDKSDAWVEAWAQIVQNETGNHPELLQKVADGFSDVSDKFRSDLAKLNADGIGPKIVTGPIKVDGGKIADLPRRAMSAILSGVAGRPTRELLTIPTIKRLYWADAERLLPYLSVEDATSLRGMAEGYGIHLPDVAKDATHTIDLKTADHIAKTHALAEMDKIFYNPGRRPILTDQLRDLIPFGNVVREHAQAFAHLIAQNPKVLRTVQMGVTSAQQSGWWTKDQYGKMQLTMIPAEALNMVTGGANMGLSGEANRLNLAFNGWPSVGPVVSLSAPALLEHFGTNDLTQRIRAFTNPYGDPNDKGDLLHTLFPGWFDKLSTSGYLANVPLVNAVGGSPSDYQQRLLNQTAMTIMRSKMASGHYNLSDENQLNNVWNDSVDAAKAMYVIRSAVQFLSPDAPQFDAKTKLKDGSVIESYLLTNDYKKMLDANKGDEYKTTLAFIDKYGPENIFSAQPFTRPLTYGLPTTAEAEAWKQQNGSFAAKFPTIYGYFAPQAGGFDYQAYLKQIAHGDREALTGPKWYHLAEARIGNAIYDNLRKALPASLNATQQAIVAKYKAQLTKEYPGFNQDALKLAADTKPQTINAFRTAIQEPTVKGTPMAAAIGDYLDIRDAVLAKQKALGLSGNQISTSKDAAPLRDILYKWGTQLSSQHPEFSNVWQHVFSYEVQNEQTQDAAA